MAMHSTRKILYFVTGLVIVGGISFFLTQSALLKGAFTTGATEKQGSIILAVANEYFDPTDADPSLLMAGLSKSNFTAVSGTKYRGINAFKAVPFIFDGLYELGVVNNTFYKVTANVEGYVSASDTFLSCTGGEDCTLGSAFLPIPTADASSTYTGNLLTLDYAYKIILYRPDLSGFDAATVTAGDLSDSSTATTCSYQAAGETYDSTKTYYKADGTASSVSYFDPDNYTVFTCPVPLATTAYNYKVSLDGYKTLTGTFKADRTANADAQQILVTDLFTAGTDPAGITIKESSGATITAEGGATDSYTVVLDTAPTGQVTVTVTPDAQLTVSPSTLTFTGTNWATPQTVTVTAVDDSTVDTAPGGKITHTATSADTDYSGLTISDVKVKITDNDTATPAGVTVTESSGSTAVTEGSTTDSYTVALNTAPTADVTITVTPDAQTTVSPATLTFTATNWATAQTVTVTAVNDTTVEGTHSGVIKHTATSTDTHYNGITISGVTATLTDNDSYGVTMTESNSSTAVTEGGATDSYTMVLNAAPTADVKITPTPDTQVTVSPATLTFTSSNWSTAQTVTVTAVSDSTTETTQTGTVKHTATSTDTNYNGITISSVTATVSDASTTTTSSALDSEDYDCTDPFVDTHGQWHQYIVCRMYNGGVVVGKKTDEFVPNDDVTNAEFIKMVDGLLLSKTSSDASGLTTDFVDVKSSDWYYPYVALAEKADVIRTRDFGTSFNPNESITRGEAAVYVARALGLTSYNFSTTYSDVASTHFAAYAIALLSAKTVDVPYDSTTDKIAVLSGYSDDTFRPDNQIARSEAAALIYRAYLAYLAK